LREISEEELLTIVGGGELTASIINALTNVLKLLYEVGNGLGSAIRRIGEGNLCPLE